MDKLYIFPEEERKIFTYSFLGYWVMIVVWVLMCACSPDQGKLGILVCVGMTASLCINALNAAKYIKYRFAKYALDIDSVSNDLGEEKRIFRKADSFHISVITLLHGRRYHSIEEKFFVLWKIGTRPPKEQISPYILLRKGYVILLPYNESIRNELERIWGIKTVPCYPRTRLVMNTMSSDDSQIPNN